MSFHVVGWVLKHSETRLADRLVLLALAEYAHDDGGKAFPKLKTIMGKAKVKESTARGCLRKLEGEGAIELTGATRGGVRIYRVLMTERAANLEGPPPSDSGPSDSEGGAPGSGERGPDPGPSNREGNRGTDPPSPSDSTAADAAPLSHLLAQLLEANGVPASKRRVTKKWADAERLMQERDGRELAQMEVLLRWGTSHPFWRANLLSMVSFREKYDQIRLQAERETTPPAGAGGARANADSDIERLERIKRQAEDQERSGP